MQRYLEAAADALDAHATELGRLDAVAGDGDLGTTARLIARVLREGCTGTPQEALRGLALEISEVAPSTAGTLLAGGLLRASTVVEGRSPKEGIVEGLQAASVAVQERGGASPGQKTMVDALEPAARSAWAALPEGTPATILLAAADAANDGATRTAKMTAVKGRAGWLSERSAGHEDAGARLVAIVLRSIADAAS